MRRVMSCLLIIFCLIPFGVPVYGEVTQRDNKECEILLNEVCVTPPYPLIQEKGEILIPLRWFATTMGASSANWDAHSHTATVIIDDFFKAHEYLSFLNGLEYADTDYPLPERLQNLNLPAYPLYSTNPPMLNKSPIGLDIVSGDLKMPWAVYDYQIKNGILYVGINWLNTLFLAQIEETPTTLCITYPTSNELDQDILALEALTTPTSAEEALALWIHGQQHRNGALQYAALSPKLKEVALGHLYKQGWVTGGSSPSLEKATIQTAFSPDKDTSIYEVVFNERNGVTEDSQIHQKITIQKDTINGKDYWFITEVTGDLDYYTILS